MPTSLVVLQLTHLFWCRPERVVAAPNHGFLEGHDLVFADELFAVFEQGGVPAAVAFVDDVIRDAKNVELAEGEVVEIGGYQMVSSGWANRTPWDTYREEDEEDLEIRIRKITDQVTAPPERTIFSLHCPPYKSGLDDAPQLTKDMHLKEAGRSTVPVGSTAVRAAIEEHQPCLGLHGHIHEAKGTTRIGRTLCINPGSSYEQGQLLGAVVDLDGKKKVKRFILTSG